MLPTSKIAKGKKMEEIVAKAIELAGLGKSIRTPGSGSGNRFKGDLFNNLDFMFEVKNEECPHFLQNIKQARRQAEIGNWDRNKWILVQRNPKSPQNNPELFAMMDFFELLELLKKNSEPKIKEMDRETSYIVKNLLIWLKKLEKTLNA